MDEATRTFSNLGLLARALFSATQNARAQAGQQSYLLVDGVSASFALTIGRGLEPSDDRKYYDWAWSADVPHHVEIDPLDRDGVVLVRRWDQPGKLRRYRLRDVREDGTSFLAHLERAGPARARSVIQHALQLFRILRETVPGLDQASDPQAIVSFHALLQAAAVVSMAPIDEQDSWTRAQTMHECLRLAHVDATAVQDSRLPAGVLRKFIESEPTTGRRLDAHLLLRHAAGALYQEAHLALIGQPRQRLLFAPETPQSKTTVVRRDVVYTPPGLARLIAEFAWKNVGRERAEVLVLDPACGSGVFLTEFQQVRAETVNAIASNSQTEVTLAGIDESSAAIAMARLALSDLQHEEDYSAFSTSAELQIGDALAVDWPAADIIIMNPPFIAWQDLDERRRAQLLAICGEQKAGRPDLAMAFVSKGIQSLRPGGVLASVVPAPLLGTVSGQKWRQSVQERAIPLLVARYRGQDVFPTAMVEPAIVAFRRMGDPSETSKPVEAVILNSAAGAGEAANRALRRRSLGDSEITARYEVYGIAAHEITAESWMPRPVQLRSLLDRIGKQTATTVQQLFTVRQGIRTGAKDVFVLSQQDLQTLPETEQLYFRPIAGNKTIRSGRIYASQYMFYPFGETGPTLANEDEARAAVPQYFQRWLDPNRPLLERRKGAPAWWLVTRAREWQYVQMPKLVSAYFGRSGQFAFDVNGSFVVGQGFAWLFKSGKRRAASETAAQRTTRLGYCYSVIFNSGCFDRLLSYYAPQVLGGQYDLSPRFVDAIPLPNFDEPGPALDTYAALDDAGHHLAEGEELDRRRTDELCAAAYGIPLAEWPPPSLI